MGLIFGTTNIYGINFVNNGVTTSLTQLNYNKTPVWYALTACSIAGTARIDKTWTATVTPSEVQNLCTYQWYRGTSIIANATAATYTTTVNDRGYQLRCLTQIGSASAWSNYGDKILQDMSSCWISGTTKVGQTMSAGIVPDSATGTYQWYRGNDVISGANSSTYLLTESERGNSVKCSFTANGDYIGTVVSGTSGTVIQEMSSIWFGSYSSKVGSWISVGVSPSGATGNYQWYRESESISGATSSSYQFVEADRGKRVMCKFVATGNFTGSLSTSYSSYIYQAVSGSAWISGTTEEGYTLTCNKSNSFDCYYLWYRDWSTLLQSSTSNTYTLTHDDAGHRISCMVVGTNYWDGSIATGQTETIWGWYDWSNSTSGSWKDYPSSPKYLTLEVPSNVKLTYALATASKAYVDGEYGRVDIAAYFIDKSNWYNIATGTTGFSASYASWEGSSTNYSSIRAEYGFQVCKNVSVEFKIAGKQRRQG